MEIEWVDTTVVNDISKGVKSQHISILRDMLEELKKNPGAWAKFPETINSQPVVHRWRLLFPGLEFSCTGGNSLKITNPAKKQWTVYVRYVNND